MPSPRSDVSAAVVNNIIYVFEGDTSSGPALTTVEAYDPATDTWSTKAPMPTARAETAAAAIGESIFVFGGYNGASLLPTNEAYNTGTNTWTTNASMPTPRTQLAAAVTNNIAYAIGGATYYCSETGTTEAYDPLIDTWAAEPSMSVARYRLRAAQVNKVIYAIGGATCSVFFNTNEALVPATPVSGHNVVLVPNAAGEGCCAGVMRTSGNVGGTCLSFNGFTFSTLGVSAVSASSLSLMTLSH